jgi:hypothetical protein
MTPAELARSLIRIVEEKKQSVERGG